MENKIACLDPWIKHVYSSLYLTYESNQPAGYEREYLASYHAQKLSDDQENYCVQDV